MNIQLLSDLHFEGHYDYGREFIERLDPSETDVLVLAGDIIPVNLGRTAQTLAAFKDKYDYVLYVPGNHEFYGTSIQDGMAMLRSAAMEAGVRLLESYFPVEIGGQRFLGDTMWFPWSVEADDRDNRRMVNDFRLIKDCNPVAFQKNERFRAFLGQSLVEGDVVITHHMPTPKAIAPRFARSRINCYFVSDMTDLIVERKPALWLFGHTHDGMALTEGPTRLYSNPMGYLGENRTRYDDRFIITLD